jgi:hypothetical protein
MAISLIKKKEFDEGGNAKHEESKDEQDQQAHAPHHTPGHHVVHHRHLLADELCAQSSASGGITSHLRQRRQSHSDPGKPRDRFDDPMAALVTGSSDTL